MNASLRRFCIISGLVVAFGIGMTLMIDLAGKKPRALPPIVPAKSETPAAKPDSAAFQAGQATRDAIDAIDKNTKSIADDTTVLVNDAAKQVGEAAKQVGEATGKAAAEASRILGEYANGLKSTSPSTEPATTLPAAPSPATAPEK
jgi:hypothetical protein